MTVDGLADCGWSPRQVRSQADQAERVFFLVRRQPGCLTARPSCAGRSRRPAAVRAAGSPVRSRPHRPHSAGAHSMVSSGSSDSPDVLPGAPGCLPGFRPVFSRSGRSVLFFAYGLPVTAASASWRSRGPACAPAERSGPPARQSSPPARRSPYPWLPARGDEPRPSPPCPRAARRSTARPPPAAPAAQRHQANAAKTACALMISKPVPRSTRHAGSPRADHNPTTAQVTPGDTDPG